MRIVPIALIAFGVFGVLKHFGLIDPAFVQLFWPLLIIAIGLAMLVRGPRWRADMRDRWPGRWERRMHRHFGPGWSNLSDDERARFRAGMRQWHADGGSGGDLDGSKANPAGPSPAPGVHPPAPGEQR